MEKIYRTTVRKLIALVAVLSHGKDMTMTEDDNWSNFLVWQRFDTEPLEQFIYHIAWLFNAENFHVAMAEWLREGK